MIGGIGDLKNLLATAQRLQAEVSRVREELAQKTVDGESGGGLVRCTATGTGEVVALTIDPKVLPTVVPALANLDTADGRVMLQDLIVGAVNVALERAREMARQEVAQVTGGVPLPPGVLGV